MDSLHLIFIIIFFLFSIIALNNHFKEDFKEHFPVANYYYRVKNSNTPLSNIFNIDPEEFNPFLINRSQFFIKFQYLIGV